MGNHKWFEMKRWAIVGASNKAGSYGSKIYKRMKSQGYTVYPVTPIYDEIDGDRTYGHMEEIDGDVDVALFVVNPRIGIQALQGCKGKCVNKLWLQPGSESVELLELAESMGIEIQEGCVLVLGI